jgi:tetratricopeptide (TPR) repeat protein
MAEIRQDYDLAITYFKNCHALLLEMLHQAVSGDHADLEIPPFSNRWDEAKELLDSINVKLSKLYLHQNLVVESLSQLYKHMTSCNNFPEFLYQSLSLEPYSDGFLPGLGHLASPLGGGSFHYWHWVSKHYLIYAELIELASTKKAKFPLPYPVPASSTNPTMALLNNVAANTGIGLFSTVDPLHTVQNAGFYLLISARAAEERWRRFYRALQSGSNPVILLQQGQDTPAMRHLKQALDLESKVDHAAIVIEILTKCHDFFKNQKFVRLSLFLATEIARIYQDTNQHDTALKYYDKVAITYRNEKWYELLGNVAHRIKECALAVGNFQLALDSAVELVYPQLSTSELQNESRITELFQLLSDSVVSNMHVNMGALTSFLKCDFCFQAQQGQVHKEHYFQVTLESRISLPVNAALKVSYIRVNFSDAMFSYLILNQESKFEKFKKCSATVRSIPGVVEEGLVAEASISLVSGRKLVFEGSLLPKENQNIEATSIVVLLEGARPLNLVYELSDRSTRSGRPRWYFHDSENVLRFKYMSTKSDHRHLRIEQREPALDLALSCTDSTYTDEFIPVTCKLRSLEKSVVRVIAIVKAYSGNAALEPDPHTSFRLPQGGDSMNTCIHYDCGIVSPGQDYEMVLLVKASKAGVRSIVLSAYVSLDPNTDIAPKISDNEYNVSDTRLLWKDSELLTLRFDHPFEFSCSFESKPTKAFSDADSMGSLIQYAEKPALHKKFCWIAQLILRNSTNGPLEVESVSIKDQKENSQIAVSAHNLSSDYSACGRML